MDATLSQRVPLRRSTGTAPAPVRPSSRSDKPQRRGKGKPRGKPFVGKGDPRNNKHGRLDKKTAAEFQDVRTEVISAFKELGGRRFLVKLGKEDRKAFANLLAKLIPQEVTGKGGTPLLGDVQLQQITQNIIALPTDELRKLVATFSRIGATLALPGAGLPK